MIFQIYKILYNEYGPQNWWPVTDERQKVPTYRNRNILSDRQKLEIIIGAILTQNTSWKNVEKAIIKLNENNLIDIDKILEIDKEKLAAVIKSSGYYNQKARKLKNVCKYLRDNFNNVKREGLLAVKGIGPETADSILLYAFKEPVFVVDAYTRRIFSRLGLVDKNISYHELQRVFLKNLKKDISVFNEYHALLVVHGKTICKTKPNCQDCVLTDMCSMS